MDIYYKKIKNTLALLKERMVFASVSVDGFMYKNCGYRKTGEVLIAPDDGFSRFVTGMHWADECDSHAWFIAYVPAAQRPSGTVRTLVVETDRDGWNVYNPQFICYINGAETQSFDTNHRSLPLDFDGEFDLSLYAYSGSMGKNLPLCCRIDYISPAVEKLYYDMLIPFEMLDIADEESNEYAVIRRALLSACDKIDLREIKNDDFVASVAAAQSVMDEYYKGVTSQRGTVICVGHSHIDCAWMWTLAQTKEKICRTTATVLSLMDRYPDFCFMESQALLYSFLKQESPALYERVKQRIDEGRWEVEGAMWVEADCNLTSGESLVRQIIHGKRFFEKEFDIDSRILWLPDVFGYSAAMPQICAKAGVEAFVTSKISWNDTNRMPYDVFNWVGIDGTKLFTYFLTAQQGSDKNHSDRYTSYVATTDPDFVKGTMKRFSQKDITESPLLTYGWGDGGGGPTAKMLETFKRVERGGMVCPAVKHGKVFGYMTQLKKQVSDLPYLPVWNGELYLEYHRGTYTSVAEVKRNNRKGEYALQLAEFLSSLAESCKAGDYKADELYDLWQILLTNQFHDILPGSSIPQVYLDSAAQFKDLFARADALTASAVGAVIKNIDTKGGLLVFNPHSFTATGPVVCDGKTYFANDVPPMGYAVIKPERRTPLAVSGNGKMENDFYRIEFNVDYTIRRIYDKQARREVLSGNGNRLIAYEDRPLEYSCWNTEQYYRQKPYEITDVISAESVRDGERCGYKITKRFMSSVITQYIWIYDFSRRIDFETEADWQEKDLLLKAEFEVTVNSDHAVYDIQFGQVERPTHYNTSWDQARFEVCGQRFADLSDHGYGVALLNDCKYGYDIHGNIISLSLIKSASYVNEYYDRMKHIFTYSLMPHIGDYREAGVIKEACLLNQPLVALPVKSNNGKLPERLSFVSPSCDNIAVETIKKAYDGNGYIVRAYETYGMSSECSFTLMRKASVCECDLLENDISDIGRKSETFSIAFAPREIKTFRIIF